MTREQKRKTPETPERRISGTAAFWIVMIVVGIGLKILLLMTSQSLPDADEATEGLMAIHILQKGIHPVYPFGVNYGAGAGWEAHLAALLFAISEPSAIPLKCVGLTHYLMTLVLVAAIAFHWRGPNAALVAAGLFATAPQTAEWALKTSGGHQVAVVLALAGWLCGLKGRIIPAFALLPLAALAHPIVSPFVAAIGAWLIATAGSWRKRGLRALGLVLCAVVEYLILRPPSQTVWNPAAEKLDLAATLVKVPRLALGLFCPNLNSFTQPQGWFLIAATLWLAVLVLAAFRGRQPRLNLVVFLVPWAILALISSHDLAPRHLLLASPIAVIVIACGVATAGRWLHILAMTLALAGCAVHLAQTEDPCIHGPGNQSRGLDRQNFALLMKQLRDLGIQHVYCLDPMLQWNIVFASREKILARWLSAQDRVPEYAVEVDRARREGKQIALVKPIAMTPPFLFGIELNPDPTLIDSYFQPAPLEPREPMKSPPTQ